MYVRTKYDKQIVALRKQFKIKLAPHEHGGLEMGRVPITILTWYKSANYN